MIIEPSAQTLHRGVGPAWRAQLQSAEAPIVGGFRRHMESQLGLGACHPLIRLCLSVVRSAEKGGWRRHLRRWSAGWVCSRKRGKGSEGGKLWLTGCSRIRPAAKYGGIFQTMRCW